MPQIGPYARVCKYGRRGVLRTRAFLQICPCAASYFIRFAQGRRFWGWPAGFCDRVSWLFSRFCPHLPTFWLAGQVSRSQPWAFGCFLLKPAGFWAEPPACRGKRARHRARSFSCYKRGFRAQLRVGGEIVATPVCGGAARQRKLPQKHSRRFPLPVQNAFRRGRALRSRV